MKVYGSAIRIMMVVSALFMTIVLFSQAQSLSNGYVPQIGQKGKDVVWVPTPQVLVDKMLELARVTPADFVIDLGSGDGRTVISAARLGAKALGVEYNPEMVTLSRENAEKEGVGDLAEFIQADLFDIDLSKATVITMFLLPELNLRLRPRLLELKAGTRIVSNTFTMREWEPDSKVTTEENWNNWNEAHLWIVPAKVEGKWMMGKGELNFTQQFQMLEGTYSSDGRSYPVKHGKLQGEIITFTIEDNNYTGKVEGSRMTGTVVNNTKGLESDWTAAR
jgi:SAM-dependent methyltransferase